MAVALRRVCGSLSMSSASTSSRVDLSGGNRCIGPYRGAYAGGALPGGAELRSVFLTRQIQVRDWRSGTRNNDDPDPVAVPPAIQLR